MEVIKLYKSKKNHVCQVNINGKICVMKKYFDEYSVVKEQEILSLLGSKELSVPKVLWNQDNQMCLDYIEGITVLDYLIELENKSSDSEYVDFINHFADLHKDLYEALRGYKKDMILGDMNLRNYITNKGKIFRIDFEDCTAGNIETDIGKMAAFALTYDPSFTDWKKTYVNSLIDIFSERINISKEKVVAEMERELDLIKIRRNICSSCVNE